MTYTVIQPAEQARLTALAEALENARVLAGWAEIRAEQQAREQMQRACVAPKMEIEDNG